MTDYNINVERCYNNGPVNPRMQIHAANKTVMSLKILAETAKVSTRSQEMDFLFLKEMSDNDNCHEFNGYNTQICRGQGHSPKTMYMPLLDMTPSDLETIMTALHQTQQITSGRNQDYVVLTADLQLYRVAVYILWAYPEQFENVVLRLGGMHTRIISIGSIGSLMAERGLYELLDSTFADVQKMMTGKKVSTKVRALRIVAE